VTTAMYSRVLRCKNLLTNRSISQGNNTNVGVAACVRRLKVALFGPNMEVPPEDGNRIQSPKRRASNKMQDDG
jgi:hypothetical protein